MGMVHHRAVDAVRREESPAPPRGGRAEQRARRRARPRGAGGRGARTPRGAAGGPCRARRASRRTAPGDRAHVLRGCRSRRSPSGSGCRSAPSSRGRCSACGGCGPVEREVGTMTRDHELIEELIAVRALGGLDADRRGAPPRRDSLARPRLRGVPAARGRLRRRRGRARVRPRPGRRPAAARRGDVRAGCSARRRGRSTCARIQGDAGACSVRSSGSRPRSSCSSAAGSSASRSRWTTAPRRGPPRSSFQGEADGATVAPRSVPASPGCSCSPPACPAARGPGLRAVGVRGRDARGRALREAVGERVAVRVRGRLGRGGSAWR